MRETVQLGYLTALLWRALAGSPRNYCLLSPVVAVNRALAMDFGVAYLEPPGVNIVNEDRTECICRQAAGKRAAWGEQFYNGQFKGNSKYAGAVVVWVLEWTIRE